MRCARCNRTMNKPAIVIGRMSVGPKCAAMLGYSKPGRVHIERATEPDPNQLDLFVGVEIPQGHAAMFAELGKALDGLAGMAAGP